MPPDLPEHLEDALADALWRDPARREARFAQLLEQHPDYADELKRTREASEREGQVMLDPLSTLADPTAESGELAGEHIGPYRILGVLGQGGMGTVHLAEQREPVRRRVALKVVKLGMDSAAVLKRFEVERQALALMSHDAIARVHDASTTDRGQPYFVMEHIKGAADRPTTAIRHKLAIRPNASRAVPAGLCRCAACAPEGRDPPRPQAPQHPGHRAEQVEPVPKIIDFGLARATDHIA